MQAAYYAKQFNISVYGLNVADSTDQEKIDSEGEASDKDFLNAVLITDGSYYSFNKMSGAKNDVVKKIMEQEAAKYEGAGQIIRNDTPATAAVISSISLLLFIIIIWRLYL